MEKNKLISIVIPCVNEEENINRTLDGILNLIKDHKYSFEIIVVNDGSKDKTWEVIRRYANTHHEVKGINLMTNFGQSAAYMAGFDLAEGDYVITVSADLEIPLENISKVIDYLDDGYDFVNTNRVGRWGGGKSGRAKQSGLANKIIGKVSGVYVKDRGSGMKGLRRNIAKNLKLYGEMHRFIPDYVSVYGPRIVEFDVEFKDRDFGQSYYKGHKRTFKVLLDIVTLFFMLYFSRKPFKAMPGRLFGFTGAVVSGIGGLIALYLLILKIIGQSIGNRPLLTLSVLLIIVGIQSIMLGMLGELMMRVYFESSNKKTYMIREIVE
ncbi:glycosyltransferase family 2 protein [candidate division WWE3 bacterium]|uniref:Glycosyltransferase family 2 protein n=1 Tax=candidate division WWE3 bacterium TaxID=2053526 RepID=A0A7X9HSL5_UNCKA|nr:glycosyltransferase family 2 protein [candidate division WWE3 bacterium]